jgi:long-chain acyl-CoA synthetase
MLQTSFERFADNTALVFVGEAPRTYRDLQQDVEHVGRMLRAAGISRGAKVAILSQNMPNWAVAYFAVAVTGGVVVPILPDFHPEEIANIIEHSEAEAIFVSESLLGKLKPEMHTSLTVFRTDDLRQISGKTAPLPDTPFEYESVGEDDLLSIIYTSGTTGRSKGVMLTHKNIVWTTQQCRSLQHIVGTDRFLSILPLPHTFENTLGLMLPVMHGASVHYIRKAPTPSVLLPALATVKPTIMLSVPLVIEKIYRSKILPQVNGKAITRTLYKISPFRKLINRMIGRKLMETFGGEIVFFGVGGAKLDAQTERFLYEAKFPLAIGYGLTETSPLLAGAVGKNRRLSSTGIPMEGVRLRIANVNANGEGEIQAQGPNVMRGYYKDPKQTQEAFTADGWFRTGDLGRFRKGMLYIHGRIKNMIVGANGENIYPEDIESVINKMGYVLESLVVQQKGRLVAMVHLNMEEIDRKVRQMKQFHDETVQNINAFIDEILLEIQNKVNEQVNHYSRIQTVIFQPEPFKKTPTLKIKRFLYYQ